MIKNAIYFIYNIIYIYIYDDANVLIATRITNKKNKSVRPKTIDLKTYHQLTLLLSLLCLYYLYFFLSLSSCLLLLSYINNKEIILIFIIIIRIFYLYLLFMYIVQQTSKT